MHKRLKWIGIILVSPLLLVILLAVLLYVPPIQNWAVKEVAAYASRHTKMDIHVDHVHLVFPLDLGIDGVRVLQQNDSLPQVKDTLADIAHLRADVQLLPLFKKQVMVDALDFHRMKVNTSTLIHTTRISGEVGTLTLKAHGIDLGKEYVHVDGVQLADARLRVELSDTVPKDTTPSKNFWKIAIRHLKIHNTDFALHLPGDTLVVACHFDRTWGQQAYLDLFKNLYTVQQLDWTGGAFHFDNRFKTHTRQGIDFAHLGLNALTLRADSFYYCDRKINVKVRQAKFKEQSGIAVNDFHGLFRMDSTMVSLPRLYLRTPYSFVQGKFYMDSNAFADTDPGKVEANLLGQIGKEDLMFFIDGMPRGFWAQWPDRPLSLSGQLRGNLQLARFEDLTVSLPTAFWLHANGFVGQLTDPARFYTRVRLKGRTNNLGFIRSFLSASLNQQLLLPRITIDGYGEYHDQRVAANVVVGEGRGRVHAVGKIDLRRMAYAAKVNATNLAVTHFYKGLSVKPFTGVAEVRGVGTDLFSPKTKIRAKARVVRFGIPGYNLDHINLQARLAGGRAHVVADSHNALLQGLLTLDALIPHSRKIGATLSADIRCADLYHLGLYDSPLTVSLCGTVDVASDLKDHHLLQGMLSDMTVRDTAHVYRPDDVTMDVKTTPTLTHAIIDCGDFYLNMDAAAGYQRLLNTGNRLLMEIRRQIDRRVIDQHALRARLPEARIYLHSGDDNFFSGLLAHFGYTFRRADVDLSLSPSEGLNGYMNVDSLLSYNPRHLIDTIRVNFNSDAVTTHYQAMVHNGPQQHPSFTALFNGAMSAHGTDLVATILDRRGQTGIRLPLSAEMVDDGIRFHMPNDSSIILGYKDFTVNDSNYVFLTRANRVSASVDLQAADGQGIQLYTDDGNLEALQDLTLSLHKFDLEKVLSVIPYAPAVSGVMDGDFHVVQTKDELSVSSDVAVQNLVYQDCPMGNVESQFVYVPRSDGSHQVNGLLFVNDNQVATIDGTYQSQGAGYLDAKLTMEKTPLDLLNGFIPQRLFGFRGYGEGELSIKGPLSKPDVNGEVFLDSSYLVSEPYGVTLRFAEDPVRIQNSKLLFENFEVFANNDQPLDIAGSFDFSNLDRMMMNIRMRAKNFELIDAKRNYRSTAYGKAFVNFFGTMTGPVSSLKLRGKVDVLGNTDMTYILRESEISTDNELDELVKFTDFQDTIPDHVIRPKPEGLDMMLGIDIDEQAHILCALNADQSNYIDLMGGGNLIMTYDPENSLQLTGKYTLNDGEMKYSLPIIPLKTFSIEDGSYIEFRGDPMDPTLHITATEMMRANVNSSSGGQQSVNFKCGVQLSQTLQKMGVEFIISSPENTEIQNELNTMSVEERGKIAVAMLASGMYLNGNNTNSFTMNSALTAFLNSEINTITGKAMKSLGLDVGVSVDNTTNASGSLHTDYSFKFAKRFWNNRLSFIVGGKLQSGAEINNQRNNDGAFFDNVELQYRLGSTSSKYIRGYYNNNVYDWLEGQVGVYGVGFIWRRQLSHFKDIFSFKDETEEIPDSAEKSKKVKK
ncbi:MAG: translocation/assembly module TamB domain-containing protein [Prevotella sp.]|nr:translocation/assembly module TamB domain-containing protein [Prevotella sp.]